jgi:DNA gyrase inhibitor GyrI
MITMTNFAEVELPDVPVMMVISDTGLKGSSQAFNLLESKLPTLKNRRFYGIVLGTPPTEEYRACVALSAEDNPEQMSLGTWTVPGGKYMRAKIADWETNIEAIGKTFREMAQTFPVDGTRPSIEFYRSQKELILFLPVM